MHLQKHIWVLCDTDNYIYGDLVVFTSRFKAFEYSKKVYTFKNKTYIFKHNDNIYEVYKDIKHFKYKKEPLATIRRIKVN